MWIKRRGVEAWYVHVLEITIDISHVAVHSPATSSIFSTEMKSEIWHYRLRKYVHAFINVVHPEFVEHYQRANEDHCLNSNPPPPQAPMSLKYHP